MPNSTTCNIAFYNIENLFDTIDDQHTNDDDFLPTSEKKWTPKRYRNKIRKLGKVIASIGSGKSTESPIVIGLAEVENKKVLHDLTRSKHLISHKYSYIHFDSSDERGIDVALLYKSNAFFVHKAEAFPVYLENDKGQRDFTRDILLVTGQLADEDVHILVNHWSSRREGQKETEHKRIQAAKKVNEIISHLKSIDTNAKIIVMGDFNDDPSNASIKLMETESELFNPFKTVGTKYKGSLSHRFEWFLFDQILLSTNLLTQSTSQLTFNTADIFNTKMLQNYHGKYKGQPFRTYVGKRYKGGYSDHFPVFVNLRRT